MFRILEDTSDVVGDGVLGTTVTGEGVSFSGAHSSLGRNLGFSWAKLN